MNKKLSLILLILIILLILSSCAVIKQKNRFIDYKRATVQKNKSLKLDRYYYLKYISKSNRCEDHEIMIRPLILYKNGVANIWMGSVSGPSQFMFGKYDYTSKNYCDQFKKYNTLMYAHKSLYQNMHIKSGKAKKEIKDWGIYNMVGDTIKIAYYDRIRPGSFIIPIFPYDLIETYGIIQNDTTFVIPDGLTGRKNEVYHFRQYSPKPDSLNATIRSRIFKSKKWPPIYIPLLDYD